MSPILHCLSSDLTTFRVNLGDRQKTITESKRFFFYISFKMVYKVFEEKLQQIMSAIFSCRFG